MAIAAALVGWAVVVLQDRWLDDLEGELADARRQAASGGETATSSEGSAAVGVGAPAADSNQGAAELKRLKGELEAGKAEREVLQHLVRQSETELERLRTKVDEQAQAAQQSGREYRTLTRTRLRSGPSTDTAELGVMAEGASLRVIDTVANGTWHEVRIQGYAFHELLKPAQGE